MNQLKSLCGWRKLRSHFWFTEIKISIFGTTQLFPWNFFYQYMLVWVVVLCCPCPHVEALARGPPGWCSLLSSCHHKPLLHNSGNATYGHSVCSWVFVHLGAASLEQDTEEYVLNHLHAVLG